MAETQAMIARMPRVTVLVPVRNGVPYVENAVRSVLGQSFRDLRLFVSDNRSTDATPEMLVRLAGDDARLEVEHQSVGLSMVAHFNNCLGRVETEYFMLLCHDDYLASPQALEKACAVLDSQPDVNAVYCDLLYVNAQGRRIIAREFGRNGRFDAGAVGRASILAARNLFGIPLLVRACAARGLRYDESLPYAADVDLAIAGAAGGSLFHIAEPLIANRYHPGNATWRFVADAWRQMERIAAKHAIPLSPLDRVRARASAYAMAVVKRFFMTYVAIRH